jgi:2-C-methyl-D-erythritol 4-phosphate cytidylyltransferase
VAGIGELFTQIMDHPVGGLWGVPVRDTLKQVDALGNIVLTISRDQLWHAQTPQIFRFELLYQALLKASHDKIDITDEASSLEHLGYHPKMVQGSYANIKITWPEDLISAEHWLKQHEVFR